MNGKPQLRAGQLLSRPRGRHGGTIISIETLHSLRTTPPELRGDGKKLGNQSNVERMLRDFPLLFDVRDVELTSLNMYLKDLFTGYRGAKERSAQKTASKLEKKGWTAPRRSIRSRSALAAC